MIDRMDLTAVVLKQSLKCSERAYQRLRSRAKYKFDEPLLTAPALLFDYLFRLTDF